MIHPRVTMNLVPGFVISNRLNMILTYGITKRVVCLRRHELRYRRKVKKTYYGRPDRNTHAQTQLVLHRNIDGSYAF